MCIRCTISKVVPATALSLVLGLPAVVSADTITVCWDGSGDYLTIQAGIDAAGDGDEVVVCDGVYTGPGNKNLDFGGKAITVRSENGPDNCIIDCEGDGRGFHFHSGETTDAVVNGFTITNGYTDDSGGAIYCDGSSPTITNCTITRNSAVGCGSGIYCEYGSPAITNCTLTENAAGPPPGPAGWAVYCEYGSPTITNCTISENTGGGVACGYGSATVSNCTIAENVVGENVACAGVGFWEGTFTLTDCTISGNRAGWAAGGVACLLNANVTIDNCTITGNTVKQAVYGGGGVYCQESSPVITNCTISNNTVQGGFDASGGGIYSYVGHPTISNCTIAENTAASEGGGLYCEYGDPTITNCTIAGNTAGFGGGVYCAYDSNPTITNCTVAANTAGYGGGICCSYESNPTITNCLITGNTAQSDDYAARGGGVHCGDGSSATVVNCAIVGNAAVGDGGYGGAISCRGDSNPTIANCILWGDSAAHGPEIALVEGATLAVCYSDVEGGQAAVYQDGTLNWGDGNIDADPLFVDPDGPDDDPTTWEDNNYRLAGGSPCIDAGDNEAVPEGVTTDLDGNPRFIDDPDTEDTGNGDPPIVDMGSYEYQIPGDLNGDGCVDHSDLGILLSDWQCSGGDCPGDCDGDGDTDHADLGILLAYWGAGCP